MEKRYAWRVEMPCGAGPYIPFEGCRNGTECDKYSRTYGHSGKQMEMGSAHSDNDHPSPYWDGNMGWIFTSEHSCGLEDFTSIYLWFDGFVEKLANDGFLAVCYEIIPETDTDYLQGETIQVGFRKSRAHIVETRSLV